jgi:hypothetical protein
LVGSGTPSYGRDDPSGRGNYDEATGLWEWYEDVPEELTGGVNVVSHAAVLNEWDLLEGAFHDVFGVDLVEVMQENVKTWRWFTVRVAYLLHGDNPLSRHFAPKPDDPPPAEVPTFDGS